ncbi:dihydropteroate synthase [Brevibacterium litoralis]|uniref:dihydropteroate synthase n=1 Tax=Brevibacterium litoralis TaxID=3138935 RepID=UPI0032EBCCA3
MREARTTTVLPTVGGGTATFGPGDPGVMAVINRSTDSFYVSSDSTERAVEAALTAHEAGAAVVDIGGVRAGRGPEVSVAEEIDLVRPVVTALADRVPDLVVSVDTWRAEVGEAVAAAGAGLLNDTWAGADPDLARVAGAHGVALVCSHTGGLPPRTDAHRNSYGQVSTDVRDAVRAGLDMLVDRARAAGVPDDRIIVDPTPDFGKNTRQSLAVVDGLADLCAGPHGVLLAISRKDFVGEATGAADPADRLAGTVAATALAIDAGVALVRAHDTAASVQTIDMVLAVRGLRDPRRSVRGLR